MDCSCCLLFGLDSIDFGFETVACIEDYDSACRNHDLLACLWISSRAGVLTSHAELAKVGDRDGFSLLQGRLEECKKPIQQRRRFFFRDPGFDECGGQSPSFASSLVPSSVAGVCF
jgi:hypothetical protein